MPTAREIMTADEKYLTADDTALDAAQRLADESIGAVPVVLQRRKAAGSRVGP
jgi:CBS-domain-containing membrane protein